MGCFALGRPDRQCRPEAAPAETLITFEEDRAEDLDERLVEAGHKGDAAAKVGCSDV